MDYTLSAYTLIKGVTQTISEDEARTLKASLAWAERIRNDWATPGLHVEIHRGDQDSADLLEWWVLRRNGQWEHGTKRDKIERTTCPSCHGNYRRRRNGTVGHHRVMIGRFHGGTCPGSGQPATTEGR